MLTFVILRAVMPPDAQRVLRETLERERMRELQKRKFAIVSRPILELTGFDFECGVASANHL